MLMPKRDRVAIYEYLFKEGVMVAKKDFHAPKHPALQNVPNLHVIKAMQSLKSRGYVKEQFAWRHYYWYLTNEGIQYLRDYLHLPAEIVPPTLKRQSKASDVRSARPTAGAADKRVDQTGAEAYRREGGFQGDRFGDGTQFSGGFGRGRAPPQQQ
ncbi:ribosomal protein S10-like protein [Dinothrombium tinctorium]|uniref:Ribosomal protein S10-like protein n=1 Tax=Dinothrombium tinctorium TaxID=1965070 RepID=A0A3S3PRL1_9ACAR|nr:ribosomal protein S10-like protein [Dinothrombium tinctorium]